MEDLIEIAQAETCLDSDAPPSDLEWRIIEINYWLEGLRTNPEIPVDEIKWCADWQERVITLLLDVECGGI